MTLHKAKGLEFDFVFIWIFMIDITAKGIYKTLF
ncbi:hypothetical protein MXS87_03220 [Escherichia coli]|nr:hypothetical protein [Escherichia coli]